ncbi:MAG: NADH:flavin oxidoreductase [Candidatus Abyssobacteria bacterium SURF_17]|uniref:NADH:flavin oxidoreductase n=1 Tax=Candidatus Abyssobacteria bacterium SURF_17 TaxID=2093361 RepID=A0A419EXP8_9BACT|nr:MAG: NADH:flavin oxidoreductase [Candidatus Abyssubacteria bacterium SURF_17]
MSELFKPGKIGLIELKNRFVRSATAEVLATDDGRVTERYFKAYEQLAKGGAGLIIPGNYYVHRMGRAIARIVLVNKDDVIGELKGVVDMMHKHGAKAVAQLNHGGRQCDPKILGATPIGPSAVRDKLSMVKPRAMTEREIEETIAAYGEGARRAKEGGFDGVQIHAAHGYLINEFLSGYTNRRTDRWGGSLEKRMRFLISVYEAIRSAVGRDYPILIKINSEDFVKGGFTLEQCITVCKRLEELGIAAIEVSGGIAEKGLVTIKGDVPMDLVLKNRSFIERFLMKFIEKSMREAARFEEAYFLPQAAAVKKNVKVPVIAVGGMRRRATMERALESGQADFISLCRPFIRQPNLVNLMQKKDGDPITCTSCNRCSIEMLVHYKPMRCYAADAPK